MIVICKEKYAWADGTKALEGLRTFTVMMRCHIDALPLPDLDQEEVAARYHFPPGSLTAGKPIQSLLPDGMTCEIEYPFTFAPLDEPVIVEGKT